MAEQSHTLKRILEIIKHYNENHKTLSDNEILDLRAELSTLSYFLVEEDIRSNERKLAIADIDLENLEEDVYERAFEKNIQDGFSNSQSAELTRKLIGRDMDLRKVRNNYKMYKAASRVFDKRLNQISQVLNSMSKRGRI